MAIVFGIFNKDRKGAARRTPAKKPKAGAANPGRSAAKQDAIQQIKALRKRVDPEVLDQAERLAKHQMGIPNESLAVAMLERARANGGKDKARVIAEIQAHLHRKGIKVEDLD